MRHTLRGYNPDTALDGLLSQLTGLVNRLRRQADEPQNVKGMIMALQADVQRLVDEMGKNTSAVQSMKQAFDLQAKQLNDQRSQISGLQAQVADLQSKQGSGQPIDAEDLSAIQETVGKLEANNATLTETNQAVAVAAPANVPDLPPVPLPPSSQAMSPPPPSDPAA